MSLASFDEFVSSQTIDEKNERYTTPGIMVLVRRVLGEIDLDPTSNAIANRTVQAKHYYTIDDNALKQEWRGRIWCNPPFGKVRGENGGYQVKFLKKGMVEYDNGHASELLYLCLGNAIYTKPFVPCWRYDICIYRGGMDFTSYDGDMSHYGFGFIFAYLGKNNTQFKNVFSEYGHIIEASTS